MAGADVGALVRRNQLRSNCLHIDSRVWQNLGADRTKLSFFGDCPDFRGRRAASAAKMGLSPSMTRLTIRAGNSRASFSRYKMGRCRLAGEYIVSLADFGYCTVKVTHVAKGAKE
jgi:hypothetical protein